MRDKNITGNLLGKSHNNNHNYELEQMKSMSESFYNYALAACSFW